MNFHAERESPDVMEERQIKRASLVIINSPLDYDNHIHIYVKFPHRCWAV